MVFEEKKAISAAEAAKKWGISVRRVRMLCAEGKVPGAYAEGIVWRIPADAPRPVDGRSLRYSGVPKSLAGLAGEVESLKERLAHMRPFTPAEKERLEEAFLIDYTHSSTAIEGNTLTLSETALVLGGMTVGTKPLKDHLEAIGHRDAFRYLVEAVRSGEPVSERFVKELHSLVLADKPQDRGTYRRIPVIITGAVHTPPQPYMVPPLMESWVREANKSRKHPLAAAAEFHLKFEAIHPFIDGNGRTGRLLANFMIMRAGYMPVSIKHEDRFAYYDAFTQYHLTGCIDSMLGIFLSAEIRRMREWLDVLGAR